MTSRTKNVFAMFSKRSDIVITNHLESEPEKVSDKVYARDLFTKD